MRFNSFVLIFLALQLNPLLAETIGAKPANKTHAIGVPHRDHVISRELFQSISEQLLMENIAEEDIDPATFDLKEDTKSKTKKDELDDIQFVSEVDKQPASK